MTRDTIVDAIVDAIAFAREWNNENVTIGGGEPTLHPDFFDILRFCLKDFENVWFATNGSQTKTMMRLLNIMHDKDKVTYNPIHGEGHLAVTLSLDKWHDKIDPKVVALWRHYSDNNPLLFEVRNVGDHVIQTGRAEESQLPSSRINPRDCVCTNLFIRPDGTIKLCGCLESPTVGDVKHGITSYWEDIIHNDYDYIGIECCKGLSAEVLRKVA